MTLISLTDCCRLLAIDGKTLRHWLAQAPQESPVPACPCHDDAGGVGQPPGAKAACRSRPSASSQTSRPRSPAHVLPLVEYAREGHYVVICPKQGLLTLEPESPE